MRDLRAFMERYYHAYNMADPEQLAAFYHPDVRLLSGQGDLVGRDAVLATYGYIIERFIDHMTPLSILVEDGRAAVEIVDRFTARCAVADFLGRSFAPGEEHVLHLCGIYACQQGQIREVTLYTR